MSSKKKLQESIRVRELMWAMPETISSSASLTDAALKMSKIGCGVLAVGTRKHPEGIITGRDIVVRGIAKGHDPNQERGLSCMSAGKLYTCQETDTIMEAAGIMKRQGVTRLAVINRHDALTGILSIGHIVREEASAQEIADLVSRIARRRNSADRPAAL